jgi:hypothetical protein
LVPNHAYHDVVRDEPTSIHNFLRLNAEWRLFHDLLAQHVARREVTDAEFVAYVRCLCALAWGQSKNKIFKTEEEKKRGARTDLHLGAR